MRSRDTPVTAPAPEATEDGSGLHVAAAPEAPAGTLGDYLRPWLRQIRRGESGAVPTVVGLIAMIVFFQLERSRFGSNENLVSLFEQTSVFALLGAAEIFALVVSEIDLSIGYVLGVGGFVIAELSASPVSLPWWLAIIGGLGATAIIGFAQGSVITRLRVPSFVVTLAGLLIWDGVMIELANVDKTAVGGVISVSPTSPVYHLVNSSMSPTLGWILLAVLLGIFAATSLMRVARHRSRGAGAPPLSTRPIVLGLAAIAGIFLVYICNDNRSSGAIALRGIPWVILVVGLVLFLYSMLLGRTQLGRGMYAAGADPEAARRAGINVPRVRRIAFTLSAMTAGIAGLVYASSLGSISTDVPGTSYTLYGVAAAVIGGASLFGGRGKPLHALLGALVIGVLYNGLELMNTSAQGQFIAAGIVLLVAASVDARLRRRAAAAQP
jgi:D-xylose transport system permease protein